MNKLVQRIKKLQPDKAKSPFLYTIWDGLFTFLFVPDHVTSGGVHIKDRMDLKRLMVHVVLALSLCYLFGMYNTGHQHFRALGVHTSFFDAAHLKLFFGISKMLPIFIVTHVVGLGIEFYYAARKGHGIEEGFLVSGALIPLIMPPDIPLLWLALAVTFAVILGKEAFGGTGMNIWNVALLARVFIFFAYPTTISGDEVWIAGFESLKSGSAVDYSWWYTGLGNSLFELFGWTLFDSQATVVDGFTGATPLSLAAKGGWDAVNAVYSDSQIWWGAIPGSVGETSKPFILLGALFLLMTRVASWRIMLSMFLGAAFTGWLFNCLGYTPFMEVTWIHQFYMGSFFFAMAFMATDPVTASSTNKGKWVYGFLIGMVGMIVRVLNPAYPEGWMLAILFMNTFSALIDHFVLQSNMKKRMKYA